MNTQLACSTFKSCMDDMPYLIKPGKNFYSAETYVGNWYEDTVRNTLRRDDFLRKRECGDLKIQRTQTMIDLLLKPVRLSSGAGYLNYGDTVQIMSPGPSCSIAVEEHPFKRGHCKKCHLALSAAVPPSSIDYAPYLNTDSIISASPLLFPVVRNSFVIENPDSPNSHSQLLYGDVFRIRALPTQHFNLYLFSAPAIRVHHLATHSAKPKVRFSDVPSTDTLWSAWPTDPQEAMRVELGVPVPMKQRLFIKHNGTGINLSTEPNFPVLTYFGEELEVTTDTKRDRCRRPSYPNMWYFDGDRSISRDSKELTDFMKRAERDAKVNIYNIDKSAAQEEKMKAEAKAKAQEDDEDDDEDPSYTVQVQQQQGPFDEKGFKQSIREMNAPKDPMSGAGGQLPFDPRTAPQPNAYSYRVFKDDPYYPNRKWNCGDANCCYIPQTYEPPQQGTDCCECVETTDPLPNPNARDYNLSDLIR